MSKYFGTDGFRGEAGITLTADHAYKVGRFLGWYYNALRERNGTLLGSDRASSKGYIVRWVEAPSNKLLTTAFEASLESVTVTRRLSVDSKIAGIAMEHRNPKVSEGRHRGQGGRQYMHLSLW